MRPALAALVVARTCCGDLRAASRAAILHTLGHCDAATRDGAAPRPGLGFVHIGAHHWFPPTRDAMLHDVATRHNWTGLLVEPSPHVFEELQRRATTTASPHVPVQAALCARSAPAVPFYAVSPTAAGDDMPSWVTEIGSLRSDHARGHQGILGREIPVEQIDVECLGFEDLVSRHGGVMDVLVVDAEGADVDLLATLPLDRLRPRVIVFEAKHEISWGGSEAARPKKIMSLLASLREAGGYDLASTDTDAGDGDLALVRAREGSVATDAPVDATQRCLLAALRGHDRGGPCVLDVDPEGAHVVLTDRGRAACLWAYGLDLNPREVGKTDIRAAHWPVTNETALFRGPWPPDGVPRLVAPLASVVAPPQPV